ncbi:MAG TPA: hypothetical protein VGC00_06140 [Thermoanaerobaculia bacterium]
MHARIFRWSSWLPASALALLTAAGAGSVPARAGEPVAQPCDCCKLVCIEAEILKAQRQRDHYKSVAGNKKMTLEEYEAGEQAAADRAERDRVTYAAGVETCNYFDPNQADDIELRRLSNAGFRFGRNDAGVIVGVNYSLKTNLESCTTSESAARYAPKLAACEGIGAAQVEHERQHVDDCEDRDPSKRKLTPAQTAAGELAGYESELRKLEELRLNVAAQCKAKSCESDKADWEAAADRMLLFVDDVLQRGAPKPPSKSPLSTKPARGARSGSGR